jgi:hypothetical protein
MNQSNFRKLLATPRATSYDEKEIHKKKERKPAGGKFKLTTEKQIEQSQSFEGYRDRALERRIGVDKSDPHNSLLETRALALERINKTVEMKNIAVQGAEQDATSYIDTLTSENVNVEDLPIFIKEIFQYAIPNKSDLGKHNIYEGRSAYLFNLCDDSPPQFIIKPKKQIILQRKGCDYVALDILLNVKERENITLKAVTEEKGAPIRVDDDDDDDIFGDAGQDYVLEIDPEREKLIKQIKPSGELMLDTLSGSEDDHDGEDTNLNTLLQQGHQMAISFGVAPASPDIDDNHDIEPLDMYMEMENSSDDDEDMPSTLDANKRPGSSILGSKGKKPKSGKEGAKLNREMQVI